MKGKGLILASALLFILGAIWGSTHDVQHECHLSRNLSRAPIQVVLSNNLMLVASSALGSVLFGATTLVNLLFNGLWLGVLVNSAHKCGVSIREILVLIIPHGIFEIPAIIIAGAAGFKIPYEVVRYLFGRKEQPLTKGDIKEYLTLAAISIVLIVIAAWIEANVTLRIAKSMLNSTKGV